MPPLSSQIDQGQILSNLLAVSDAPEDVEPKIAYLGPIGTFTEEALRSQFDTDAFTPMPLRTMPEVIAAVDVEDADWGFLAIENSIEGTVNVALDSLIFDANLLIQREVVVNIRQSLIVPKGVKLADIKRVLTFPVAGAQCRVFLNSKLPDVEMVAANSTADAVRQLSRSSSKNTAAIGPMLAAEIYGLDVLEPDISDNSENQTRFVLVGAKGIPARTGHDKTSIVVFQSADKPGSLHGILGHFSARNINLVKLESRPTKKALGDYCFVIDLEGHIDDEVVADCLRDLHAQSKDVKFLGSYPAVGASAGKRRRDAVAAWRNADDWMTALRAQVAPDPRRNRRLKVVK